MFDRYIIEKIQIVWQDYPDFSGTRVLNCPPELRVIKDFFYKSYWGEVISIARGIKNHYGVGMNDSGFRFPSDLDPDEEVFEGVELFDPKDEIYIDEKDFERLALKFFKAVIDGSTSHQKLTKEPWWNEFISIVNQLESKLID
ncbi:MAG: hypothetical protein ACFBSE_10565 [Prochloraceae cyanobacterium]